MITFGQLVHRARSLVVGGNRALLGITGSPGSGKTTLAEQLIQTLAPVPPPPLIPAQWVAYVPMDGFHLADTEFARLHRRGRKGAPDTFDPAGYAALLRRLHEDGDDVVYAPGFDRSLEQPIAGAIPVPPYARLIITEGNYLLLTDHGWDRVRPQLDDVCTSTSTRTSACTGSSPAMSGSARNPPRRSPGPPAPTNATPSSSARPGPTPISSSRPA